MPEWLEKVVIEKVSLDKLIGNLDKFVAEESNLNELSSFQLALLRDQRESMQKYSNVLKARIELAEAEMDA